METPGEKIQLDVVRQVCAVLHDKTRLRAAHLIAANPGITVSQMCDVLRMDQATLSHHLATLRQVGFIASTPGTEDARTECYRIQAPLIDGLQHVAAFMQLAGGDQSDPRLKDIGSLLRPLLEMPNIAEAPRKYTYSDKVRDRKPPAKIAREQKAAPAAKAARPVKKSTFCSLALIPAPHIVQYGDAQLFDVNVSLPLPLVHASLEENIGPNAAAVLVNTQDVHPVFAAEILDDARHASPKAVLVAIGDTRGEELGADHYFSFEDRHQIPALLNQLLEKPAETLARGQAPLTDKVEDASCRQIHR